jgi:hypothetical protein
MFYPVRFRNHKKIGTYSRLKAFTKFSNNQNKSKMATSFSPFPNNNDTQIRFEINGFVKPENKELYDALVKALKQIVKP